MEEKEKKLKKRFQDVVELAIFVYLIILCTITLSFLVPIYDHYQKEIDKEITHCEVTSICNEYAQAKSIAYNPGTEVYEFNGLSVHKEILIASCNG